MLSIHDAQIHITAKSSPKNDKALHIVNYMTHAFHATGRVYAAPVCRQWKTSWPYSNSNTCRNVFSLHFSKLIFSHSWMRPDCLSLVFICTYLVRIIHTKNSKRFFNWVFCSDLYKYLPVLLTILTADNAISVIWYRLQCG